MRQADCLPLECRRLGVQEVAAKLEISVTALQKVDPQVVRANTGESVLSQLGERLDDGSATLNLDATARA
jgi:hypothetical protein